MRRTSVLSVALSLAALAQACASEASMDQSGLGAAGQAGAFATGGFGGVNGAAGMLATAGTTGIPVAGMGIAGTGVAGTGVAGMGVAGTTAGAAGMIAAGTTGGAAGMIAGTTGGAAGMDMAGMTGGAAGTGVMTSSDPVIPAVSGDCPSFTNGTITFMGLGGIQIVAGPKAASATAPMVFYWHGTGSTAGEFGFMAGAVRDGVVSEGGVLVSFQGTTGGDFLSGTSIFGAGDFELTDQLVACAVANHNVDPHRIFTTGCSAGGLFSGAMAALRSSYIAAAAPNSGGWVFPQMFETMYTPALMTIHGENDNVGVDFKDTSRTADTAFKGRGGFVINCNTGGGHCSGGPFASDIWEFFKAHPYGVDPNPWESALPAGFNSDCEIF